MPAHRQTLKLPVKDGAGTLAREMTRAQALRHCERTMDPSLRRAGFKCQVSKSDAQMHGGEWFRINRVKTY